jgi:hypothetical protein
MAEMAKGPVEWHDGYLLDADGVRWEWLNDPAKGWLLRHGDGTEIILADRSTST